MLTKTKIIFKVALILLLSIALPANTLAQSTEQNVIEINLPAQPLGQSITQLATQTGVLIGVDASLVENKQAPKLNGRFTPAEALIKLLSDSGLVAVESGPNNYTLERLQLASNTEPVKLPEVEVTSFMHPDTPGNPSYTRTNASSANKTNIPIMKTPVSTQIVPRAVIEDQQAVQVGDAVKNVSGVFPGFNFGGFAEDFFIRGFSTKNSNYRDGLRLPGGPRLSLANIERVEVVKGGAANLYGRIEPGGMINLVTKRPQAEKYVSVNQQFGSFGQFQTTADATGALNANGTLLGRVNLEYLTRNSFRDFGFLERIFVAPSVTWKISPRTQLDVDLMYSDADTREDHGIVAVGSQPANVPRSRFLGERADRSEVTQYNTAVSLTHMFNDNWQVRARFNHLLRDVEDPQTTGNSLNELTGELQRGFFRGDDVSNTYQGTVDLTGQFHTAGIEHNVLVGWDFYRSTNNVSAILGQASSINIFNPRYSGANLSNQPYNFFIDQKTQWNGVYFQDQITLSDKLHIMGGGRYDWASADAGFGSQSLSAAAAGSQKVNDARFSPRAGILYQPWEWLSLYGNYVQSLGSANTAFDASGNVLSPEIGEQFEAGFKTSFFNGRMNSNVAFYHIKKENLALLIPGQPFSLPVGEARSQGVEVDVSGQITQGLNLILTYTHTDAETLKGENQGKRLFNVPRNAGSLWARYDMQNKPLRGLSIGSGVFAQSRRAGDLANTFFLPAQARVDALIRYRPPAAKSLSLQFNVYNLFNSNIFGGTLGDRFTLNVGAPRIFIGSVRYTFQ